MAANGDLSFGSKECLLELQCQVFAQISSTLHTIAATATPPAKHVSEAKEFAKDIAEILEDGRIEPCTLRCSPAESGVAVAIVDRALVGVGERL